MKSWLKVLILLVPVIAFSQPNIKNGHLDLSNWDFQKQGTVRLDGEWGFYWEQFVMPTATQQSRDYFTFPGLWNGHYSGSTNLSGQGFATYTATVIVPHDISMLSLELPDFYSSYQLWVNGKDVASNGEVGASRKESVPQWLPKTVVFPSSDTLNLVLHVSNFHHVRGGSNDHIYLGLPEQLYQKREDAVVTNIVLFSGLGFIGCFFVVLFFFFRKEKAALYFAAICLTWALRAVFTNLYLFVNWFPSLDWELGVKIEYLTLYLTMMWSLLYVGKLFPSDVSNVFKYSLLVVNSIFILFTVASPAVTYTNLLPAYQFVAWVILGYVAFVVAKAIIYDRAGAWFSAISIVMGVFMFSYDMLTYQGFWNFSPLLFNVGYLLIFFLNAMAFAYQISRQVNPKPKIEFGFTLK
ncbi:MAG TPA: 7TM-DISM domain-containing protein [Cyclobacteriaceae bacterium]|nr:7TM-DISM domain-containing protein [Cyclobacteriaceae bacterium]